MTKQTVADYLVENGMRLTRRGDLGTLRAANTRYDAYISQVGMPPGWSSKNVDFDPTKVEILVNRAFEYLREGVSTWVEVELAKKVAKKYQIELENLDKSQAFVATVVNKSDANNLIAAVKEYDRLSYSTEVKELEERLPEIIDEGLDKLL